MRRQRQSEMETRESPSRVLHGGSLRTMHWINAISILILIASGLAIYNAAPLYPIAFPTWMTLGGGLSGALLWHFAAMWLLTVNLTVYVVIRIIMRQGGPELTPLRPRALVRDVGLAATFRLTHEDGVYNSVQRLFYLGITLVLFVAISSGLALWKPNQLNWLTSLMGGYEAARRVHFWTMASTVGFLAVHIAMVALVPRTLLAMVFGLTTGRKSIAASQTTE